MIVKKTLAVNLGSKTLKISAGGKQTDSFNWTRPVLPSGAKLLTHYFDGYLNLTNGNLKAKVDKTTLTATGSFRTIATETELRSWLPIEGWGNNIFNNGQVQFQNISYIVEYEIDDGLFDINFNGKRLTKCYYGTIPISKIYNQNKEV